MKSIPSRKIDITLCVLQMRTEHKKQKLPGSELLAPLMLIAKSVLFFLGNSLHTCYEVLSANITLISFAIPACSCLVSLSGCSRFDFLLVKTSPHIFSIGFKSALCALSVGILLFTTCPIHTYMFSMVFPCKCFLSHIHTHLVGCIRG